MTMTRIQGTFDEDRDLKLLCQAADDGRLMARPRRSGLMVGAAVLAVDRHGMFIVNAGNIETLWQRSYHAEELAILRAVGVAQGEATGSIVYPKIIAVCIACDRDLFTPCGVCVDIMMEFAKDAMVIHYRPSDKNLSRFLVTDLMPHYPTRK